MGRLGGRAETGWRTLFMDAAAASAGNELVPLAEGTGGPLTGCNQGRVTTRWRCEARWSTTAAPFSSHFSFFSHLASSSFLQDDRQHP